MERNLKPWQPGKVHGRPRLTLADLQETERVEALDASRNLKRESDDNNEESV